VAHNDVPWGLIWFAFIAIVWLFQGLARLAKAAQRQTVASKAKAAAVRPQPIADRVAAASASAAAAAAANVRAVAPARPARTPQPMAPPPPARRAPDAVSPGLPGRVGHEPVHIRHAAQLLAPFKHPNRLLASLVVAEALRPPLGLRSFDQR
jgi:hypothetical protein